MSEEKPTEDSLRETVHKLGDRLCKLESWAHKVPFRVRLDQVEGRTGTHGDTIRVLTESVNESLSLVSEHIVRLDKLETWVDKRNSRFASIEARLGKSQDDQNDTAKHIQYVLPAVDGIIARLDKLETTSIAIVDGIETSFADVINDIIGRLDKLESTIGGCGLEAASANHRMCISQLEARLDKLEAKLKNGVSNLLSFFNDCNVRLDKLEGSFDHHIVTRFKQSEDRLAKLEATAETKTEDASMDEEDWIPCDDFLPPDGVVVATMDRKGKHGGFGVLLKDKEAWRFANDKTITDSVPTHWKPI